MIKSDDRGVRALLGTDSGEESDIVLDWFEGLKDRLGVDPDAGWPIDTGFEEWPAPQESLPMAVLMQEITTALYERDHSHRVVEGQRRLVETMYRLTKEAEVAQQQQRVDECGPAEEAPGDGVVDAGGGGAVVPGGSEDGVAVGKGRKVAKPKDRRRAPKVSGDGRVAAVGAG